MSVVIVSGVGEEDGKKWSKVKSKMSKVKSKVFDKVNEKDVMESPKEEKLKRKTSKELISIQHQSSPQLVYSPKKGVETSNPKKSPRKVANISAKKANRKSSEIKRNEVRVVKELMDKTTAKPKRHHKKSSTNRVNGKGHNKATKKRHTKKEAQKDGKANEVKQSAIESFYTADLAVLDQLEAPELLYTTDLMLNDEDRLIDESDDDDEEELDHVNKKPYDGGAYTSDDVDFVAEEQLGASTSSGEVPTTTTKTSYEESESLDGGNLYSSVFEQPLNNEEEAIESADELDVKPSITPAVLYTEDLDDAPYEQDHKHNTSRRAETKTRYDGAGSDSYSMYEADTKAFSPNGEVHSDNSTESSSPDENRMNIENYTDMYEEKKQRKALLYSTNIPKSMSHYTEQLELLPGYSALIESPVNDSKIKKQKSKPIKFKIISSKPEHNKEKSKPKPVPPPISEMINSSDLSTLKYLLTEIVKTTEIENDTPSVPVESSVIQSKFISILGSSMNTGIQKHSRFIYPTDERSWVTEWFSAFEKVEGWKVYSLEQDFKYLATSTAKTIIREIPLPVHQKTIKPVNIGGVAGGSKFIKNGIIYKLAMDVNLGNNMWMYGGENGQSDEYAIKAAGRELDGLNAYITASITMTTPSDLLGKPDHFTLPLRFPLMILIDYCGYRVIAMSLLPIEGRDSLVYGSCDGGATVEASDPFVNASMEKIGVSLGLSKHSVGGKSIYGPGDFEIHRSANPASDPNYYALDFARLMPPEAPSPIKSIRDKEPRSVFYKLLRPSLVANWSLKNNNRGLSSDAFTGWGKDDPNRIQQCHDVINATKSLYDEFIPKLVKTFYNSVMWSSYVRWRINEGGNCNQADEVEAAKFYLELSREFMILTHCTGINYRHLGKIRRIIQNVSTSSASPSVETNDQDTELERKKKVWMEQLVMSLIVARGLKNIIKQEFREVFSDKASSGSNFQESEQPYKEIVVRYYNLLFNFKRQQADIKNADFWSKNDQYNLKHFLSERYRDLFINSDESSDLTDLRSLCDLKLVFTYLNYLLGTNFASPSTYLHSIWDTFNKNKLKNIQRVLFFKTDVTTISERIRSAGFADLVTGLKAFGDFLYSYKNSDPNSDLDEEEQVKQLKSLEYAATSLNSMFLSHPTCPITNLYSGISFYYSSKLLEENSADCLKKWYLIQALMRLKYSVHTEVRGEAGRYLRKVWKELGKMGIEEDEEEKVMRREMEKLGEVKGKGPEAKQTMMSIWQGNRNWELF